MPRITFLGAGSSVFAKNVLGDCILSDDLNDLEISLHDIDAARLEDSRLMLENIVRGSGKKVDIRAYTDRKESLKGAGYIVNAVQIGGYDPCTITDFEIPKKYGLRQTIADTLGIGGIFRGLRTIPVLEDFANDISSICPDAMLLNYTNPMSILTGYLQRYTPVRVVGLCHSVQVCVPHLLQNLHMHDKVDGARWEIAGINHQAWLLKVEDKDGNDLYPEIKRRAKDFLDGKVDFPSPPKEKPGDPEGASEDKVRLELMLKFGYYITESSEHNAEYTPWFIKSKYPELIERYNIPLDEYPRRCINHINGWAKMREQVIGSSEIKHKRSHEYAAHIISAMENDKAYRVHGNVMNTGLITNLPQNACVEVACLIDRNGINPTYVGDLPKQCAAINRTNINVHLLTIQAAHSRKREDVYMAAMLDPHTAAELSMDDIIAMCNEMFEAHGDWLPAYK